jgi:hypothetical protein
LNGKSLQPMWKLNLAAQFMAFLADKVLNIFERASTYNMRVFSFLFNSNIFKESQKGLLRPELKREWNLDPQKQTTT